MLRKRRSIKRMLAATMVISSVCAASCGIRAAFLRGGTYQRYRCIVGAFANWCEADREWTQLLLLKRGR